MISRTKTELDEKTINLMFKKQGIENITNITPLTNGEFNSAYFIKTDDKEYVLKVAPNTSTKVCTYEKNMMQSEVFWYEQIRNKTKIDVPKVYFSDFSKEIINADYFVMEKIDGEQLDKIKLTPDEKIEAAIMTPKLATQIHKISNDKFGYIQNDLYDTWYDAIRSMVEALISDAKKMGKECKNGKRLLSYIDKYKTILEKAPCSMVNFDMWHPNILCSRKNGKINYTWIDPERSFWGDHIADFICFEFLTPIRKKTKSVEAYNSLSDTKVKLNQDEIIRYSIALGYIGLIMEVEKYYRYSPAHFGWWRNVISCAAIFSQVFKELKNG